MAVPGLIGEQLVHGLACFIDHNICVSKRTEHFYTITTIMHSCLKISVKIVSWLSVYRIAVLRKNSLIHIMYM